jgi:hypothetical protein
LSSDGHPLVRGFESADLGIASRQYGRVATVGVAGEDGERDPA